MAKFRCIKCNEVIELNQYRGFRAREHKCKCGGSIQSIFYCEVRGESPERIKTATNNNHVNPITGHKYFKAWKNKMNMVFIIDVNNKFIELTIEEHNTFDFQFFK